LEAWGKELVRIPNEDREGGGAETIENEGTTIHEVGD